MSVLASLKFKWILSIPLCQFELVQSSNGSYYNFVSVLASLKFKVPVLAIASSKFKWILL